MIKQTLKLLALPMLLLLAFPTTALKAGDFTYKVNADGTNTITITGYSDPIGAVGIPSTIAGQTVTRIGEFAFSYCADLASVTIPDSVIWIEQGAFYRCSGLTSVTIPNSVIWIEGDTFNHCTGLTSVMIGNSVKSIGGYALADCPSLTAITVEGGNLFFSSLDGVLFSKNQNTLIQYPAGKAGRYTIPDSVTSFGQRAFFRCTNLARVTIPTGIGELIDWETFYYCTGLRGIFFKGNAPFTFGGDLFLGATNSTVYYLPETTGWDATFGGRPTRLWLPEIQGDGSFGMGTNQFGFNINWSSGMVIVVEACTNLANPAWSPLQTNTLTGDSFYFSDPGWTNYPGRFYRIRSP